MSTPTRLWLPHVHFSVIVYMCTSYCACVNSTIGILVFSPDNMSRMISYDVRAFDGFGLKARPKCTNAFISNEQALVWTSSQCRIVEKAAWKRSSFDAFVNKTESFQGPLICVEAAWDPDKTERVKFVAIFPFYFSHLHYRLNLF